MEEAMGQVAARGVKERMAGIAKVVALLNQERRGLSVQQVARLVNMSLTLLRDNNFRVCRGALEALAAAARVAGESLKLHLNAMLPAIVERLGDSRQPVRDAARCLLLALMEIASPTTVIERAGNYAWSHKSWKVREEFARSAASAISLFAAAELPFQKLLLPKVVQTLEDSNCNVREAGMFCLQELYRQGGAHVRDELQLHQLRPSQLKDVLQRFDKIEPGNSTTGVVLSQLSPPEPKSAVGIYQRGGPKVKSTVAHASEAGNMGETENKVVAVKVESEKELMREVEKVAGLLAPEHDWSTRIAAMQRVEGLVLGGAAEYACFLLLLKQLVEPLTAQLSDRRSSVVKQVCHLLDFLSKEMLLEFEPYAEIFIPVLFKLVVITVQVIAESADDCIKTMLRHCRIARVIPRIMDTAKNDRNAVLRARCCEYIMLILDQWADTPEIQQLVEQFEDTIKCCTADAMSEVRAIARQCYHLFKRSWPDRSSRLFSTFEATVQRVLAEEDRNSPKQRAFPPLKDRSPSVTKHSAPSTECKGMDMADSESLLSPFREQARSDDAHVGVKPLGDAAGRLFEGLGSASDASFLLPSGHGNGRNSGSGSSFSGCVSSRPLSVDSPSARDPQQPASMPTGGQARGTTSANVGVCGDVMVSASKGRCRYVKADLASVSTVAGNGSREGNGSVCEGTDAKHVLKANTQLFEKPLPGFQRPLLKSSGSQESLLGSEHLAIFGPCGRVQNYPEGLISLRKALCNGLGTYSDWSARVATFNYLKELLQQGPRGLQEVAQSFDKVIGLFSEHLEDAHNRVAQAALSALIQLVPSCHKLLELYLERILPRIFSRLVDAKEVIRHLGALVLEVVANTYSLESLLPALLRSLDEQRSGKAKGAVIDFAIAGFAKLASRDELLGVNGILKLWLGKIASLTHDKSSKLKESAIGGILSVYAYDSATVLNFISSLPIEEQSLLRRALRHCAPQIEVDLLAHMQSRSQRSREKPGKAHKQSPPANGDQGTWRGMSRGSSELSVGSLLSSGLSNNDIKQAEPACPGTKETCQSTPKLFPSKVGDFGETKGRLMNESHRCEDNISSLEQPRILPVQQVGEDGENHMVPLLDLKGLVSNEELVLKSDLQGRQMHSKNEIKFGEKTIKISLVKSVAQDVLSSLPLKMPYWCRDKSTHEKCEILREFLQLSRANNSSIWTEHMKQMLSVVLEALTDTDAVVREGGLDVILEMAKNQGDQLNGAVASVLLKLIELTGDPVARVFSAADRCLNMVLSCLHPQQCLKAIIPLLSSGDDKTLVTCIKSLTKIVGRLSAEDLMTQLQSFLPALLNACGSQSEDVRESVVFCLVDIYIALGRSFIPYLGSLSSTQLRLVTIYANRISQERAGIALNPRQTQAPSPMFPCSS